MYKRFFPLFCLFLSLMLTACAAPPESAPPSQTVASSPSAAATPSPETAQPTPSVDAAPTSAPTSASPSVLVAYFSCTGGTEAVAQHIAGALDAQLYAIQPEEPYTAEDLDYGNDNSRTSQEHEDASARPKISGAVADMAQYDVIFLGYPIWWGEAPRILSTFLESYDFSGKTIVPFCTSASSGIGSSDTALHSLCDAAWLPGMRFARGASREDATEWIESLGLGLTAK